MLNQEQLNELLTEAIVEVEEAEVELDPQKILPQVRISKATTWFGLCRKRDGLFQINISKYHLSNPVNAVYETIVHEVLHTVDGCMNHGAKWRYVANMVNKKYGYDISRTGTMKSGVKLDTPIEIFKYTIKCQDCGHLYKRKQKSNLVKNPSGYKCSKCGGKLKLQK